MIRKDKRRGRKGLDGRTMPDVTMAGVVKLHPGVSDLLPNLQLVQKLGAGVDGILQDRSLAEHVHIARLKSDAPAEEIAEYCLALVTKRWIRFVALSLCLCVSFFPKPVPTFGGHALAYPPRIRLAC